MRFIIFITLLFICISSQGQVSEILDFEKNHVLDSTWWKTSAPKDLYAIDFDSSEKYAGNNSLKLKSISDKSSEEYASLIYELPAVCKGKKITLTSYIKNSSPNDIAYIWIRVDPSLGYKKSSSDVKDESNKWVKHEIEIEIDLEENDYKEIAFGGVYKGSGEVWFDDFELKVDGVKWENCSSKNIYPAHQDETFFSGSKINLSNIENADSSSLVSLGKIWGYLKYYHPTIAKGEYNWDFELFRILPEYLAINTQKEREKFLYEWVKKIGNIQEKKSYVKKVFNNNDYSNLYWIDTELKNKQLKNLLKIFAISPNKSSRKFYFNRVEGIGNVKFKNEELYRRNQFPDVGFRLLTLYRFWNAIEYFFPYKKMTDTEWKDVLPKYVKRFIFCENELEYELLVQELLSEIDDSHGILRGGNKILSWKGVNYSNLKLRFIGANLVVNGFYDVNIEDFENLKLGTIIRKINDVVVDSIISNKRKYYPSSNEKTYLRNLAYDILRSNQDSINIEYINPEGRIESKKIKLYNRRQINYFSDRDKESYKILKEDIGYIDIGLVKDDDVPGIIETFKEFKYLIIDMRKYPTAYTVNSIGSFLIKKPTPFAMFDIFNADTPGKFDKSDPVIIQPTEDNLHFKGEVFLLVDEYTQSAGEYTTMAFSEGNTKIIGSNTAGANGDISWLNLPGGLLISFSSNGVFNSDLKSFQRSGISPDYYVYPSIQNIIRNEDLLLQKALEIIEE